MTIDLNRATTLVCMLLLTSVASAQVSFDQVPVTYFESKPNDPIARLQQRINAGEVKLAHDEKRGYLESVLEQLGAKPSSQVLVYSKTSFQLKQIGPLTPRAIYFSDDIYMGWVQGGEVMEFSAVDAVLGAVFYTLGQHQDDHPRFRRHTHECLQCHGSTMTRGVPGHVVRSVYAAPDGQPLLNFGSFLTDHQSPLKERWGGWYVTGRHGDQRHLGNLIVRSDDTPDRLDLNRGANHCDLNEFFNTAPYLTPHSDIVALMVLEHQATMHNVLTQAQYLTQNALRDQKTLNEMLDRPTDYRSETTLLRLRSAAAPVVKTLLFSGETALTAQIRGTSAFAEDYASREPKTADGRSLREFDLQTRLFKYPCSSQIYSPSFEKLPDELKNLIYQQLWDVLTGKDQSAPFRHLSQEDRLAILNILRGTKSKLPEYWAKS